MMSENKRFKVIQQYPYVFVYDKKSIALTKKISDGGDGE